MEGEAPDLVLARVSQACQELLANPVIEDFEVRLP
ncbi:MAG: phosphoribosylformylglycinamidine synthase subunit PurS [Thermoanaerobaculum sp.]|nr:phosphoribosylformylglycinamidine synthase subunit PurS [Thermoanaerobaculum sp.]